MNATTPQELTKDQIYAFIEQWYESNVDNPSERTRLKNRFYQSLEESEVVQDMARTPALTKILAILNASGELPRYKAYLYSQCLRILFYDWELSCFLVGEDVERVITPGDKGKILQAVAAEMQTNVKSLGRYVITESRLQEIINDRLQSIGLQNASQTSELIVVHLREHDAILCRSGDIFYTFVHQRFFEYFHAAYWARYFETAHELDWDSLQTKVFGEYWQDDSWHPTLVLIAAMMHESFVGEVVEYLIDQDGEGEAENFKNLFLAANCLAEIKWWGEIKEATNHLRDSLKQLAISEEQSDEIREQAVTALRVTWGCSEIESWIAGNVKSAFVVYSNSNMTKTIK